MKWECKTSRIIILLVTYQDLEVISRYSVCDKAWPQWNLDLGMGRKVSLLRCVQTTLEVCVACYPTCTGKSSSGNETAGL
jgi:hypothetical protein